MPQEAKCGLGFAGEETIEITILLGLVLWRSVMGPENLGIIIRDWFSFGEFVYR